MTSRSFLGILSCSLFVLLAVSQVSAQDETFPCYAKDFNSTEGYKPSTAKDDLAVLNLAAVAFEKWLNNGENKTISCTADSINGYAVNVTNSCIKVSEEGTSYAIDFKAKFDCMGPTLTQTSATVQYYALAHRPNVTLSGGRKASPVVTSVKMVDGIELDRIIIQQLVVRELAPAPGPMMKEITDSIEQGVARKTLIPLAGSPRAAPGPNQALPMSYTPASAMLPMALPMEMPMSMAEMPSNAMLNQAMLPMLNQAMMGRPATVFADTGDSSSDEMSEESAQATADMADALAMLASRSSLGRGVTPAAGSSEDDEAMSSEDRAALLSDLMATSAADEPLRAERASARGDAAILTAAGPSSYDLWGGAAERASLPASTSAQLLRSAAAPQAGSAASALRSGVNAVAGGTTTSAGGVNPTRSAAAAPAAANPAGGVLPARSAAAPVAGKAAGGIMPMRSAAAGVGGSAAGGIMPLRASSSMGGDRGAAEASAAARRLPRTEVDSGDEEGAAGVTAVRQAGGVVSAGAGNDLGTRRRLRA